MAYLNVGQNYLLMAPKVLGSEITYIRFDKRIEGKNWQETFYLDPTMSIEYEKGNYGKGVFRASLRAFMMDEILEINEIKMDIICAGAFYFNQERAISVPDLFGCLKFLNNQINGFIKHNKKDFINVVFRIENAGPALIEELTKFLLASR